MIRTNLSTRPFYNERAVHLVLGLLGALILAVTLFNVTRIVSLSRRHTELGAQAAKNETRAGELRAAAARTRQSIDRRELEAVAKAAREANAIIDRRTFSWTDLFNRFETTLPPDVRIASIRPRVERDGGVTVSMVVVGRRVEDIDEFMENLEGTGAFADVLSVEESTTEEGLLQAVLEGRYLASSVKTVKSRGN